MKNQPKTIEAEVTVTSVVPLETSNEAITALTVMQSKIDPKDCDKALVNLVKGFQKVYAAFQKKSLGLAHDVISMAQAKALTKDCVRKSLLLGGFADKYYASKIALVATESEAAQLFLTKDPAKKLNFNLCYGVASGGLSVEEAFATRDGKLLPETASTSRPPDGSSKGNDGAEDGAEDGEEDSASTMTVKEAKALLLDVIVCMTSNGASAGVFAANLTEVWHKAFTTKGKCLRPCTFSASDKTA